MQLPLPLPKPAKKPKRGRPRKYNGAVSHLRRPALASRFPVHVTLRVRREVWNLRSGRSFRVLHRAFNKARNQFGFRLNHYSIQGNHAHFIVEAVDARALSRGMQGLGIRMAKGLNGLMKRSGAVLADRYHARILRTPTETKRALHYVLFNRHKHLAEMGQPVPSGYLDPYSSARTDLEPSPTVAPHTWLLQRASETS